MGEADGQGVQPLVERDEVAVEHPVGADLVGVGVPAIDLGEGDLDADIGFDQ